MNAKLNTKQNIDIKPSYVQHASAQKEETKHLPEKKFCAGAVVVTVWNNVSVDDYGKTREYKTLSIDRRYKDRNTGEWKSANNFRTNDLPKAALALNKAYEYLNFREFGSGNELPELDDE